MKDEESVKSIKREISKLGLRGSEFTDIPLMV